MYGIWLIVCVEVDCECVDHFEGWGGSIECAGRVLNV